LQNQIKFCNITGLKKWPLTTKYFIIMKKSIKIALLALVLLTSAQTVFSQAKVNVFAIKLGVIMRQTPWTVGLGWNIVDDNGNAWKKQFDARKSWNMPFYPSWIRGEKYFDKGWSAVINSALNQYKSGKIINTEINKSSSTNFSFDLNAKYDFHELYDFSTLWFKQSTKVCDVYAISGFGFTARNTSKVHGCATYNIGFGVTAIIYQGWGVNLEAMSKFGLTAPFFTTPANYLQYTFGAVYRFKATQRIGRKNGVGRRYMIKH
jgi:OOP family OmpA-OmpF porin